MNELEKQILELIEDNFSCKCSDLTCNAKGTTHKASIAISKFFLEEIKEAYNEGYGSGANRKAITSDDYLKSKYKI